MRLTLSGIFLIFLYFFMTRNSFFKMAPDCRSDHPDDDDKGNHVSGNADVVDCGMLHAALDEQRRAQNDRSEDDRDDQPVDDRFNAVDEFVLSFETQSESAASLV